MSYFEFPHTRTYDSDLGWLIKSFKTAAEAIEGLEEWRASTEATIEDLQAFYEAITSGDLPEGVQEGIEKWLNLHAFDLIGEMVRHVYFGLSDAGYFIVTIPTQWRELIFNTTGYDITVDIEPEYGHLTISY